MSNATAKTFDAVQSVRIVRDALSGQIASMTVDEENRWLRSEELADPTLKRLMDRASAAAACTDTSVGKTVGTLPGKTDQT